MMGFKEWMIHMAKQKKIAESKVTPDRSDSDKGSTQKIVKRILEDRSASH